MLCDVPYQCKEILLEILEDHRLVFVKKISASGQPNAQSLGQKESFIAFVLYFLKYVNIMTTRIGYEEIGSLTPMFQYLQQYIVLLKSVDKAELQREATLLQFTVVMIIFTMFYSVEGFNHSEKFDMKKLKKTVPQMEENAIAKECLKFSYGFFCNILQLVLSSEHELFLDVILPMVYFLSEYKNHTLYIFQNFKAFQNIMNKLLKVVSERLKRSSSLTAEAMEELAANHIMYVEANLVGFIPLKSFFFKSKKKFVLLADDKNTFALKLYQVKKLVEGLKGFQVVAEATEAPEEELP